MKRITFRINRESSLLKRFFSNNYNITPKIEGFKFEKLIDGNIQEAIKTNWGGKLNWDKVLKYFDKYRREPGNTRFRHKISVYLHDFLFAGSQMGSNFEDISSQMPEIFINVDEDCRDLLLNIPWELTSKSPGKNSHSDLFDQTFASLPLARIIEKKSSKLKLKKKERFHVIYCISEPDYCKYEPCDKKAINAEQFNFGVKGILEEMSGVLTFKSVIGKDNSFSPRFSALIGEIDNVPPHLLIVICHGRTENGIPQLRFEEWSDVSKISKALERNGKTLAVLLIACDQVFLDDKPAANSGALAFLQYGIPAVIAMQSRVKEDSAERFIRTVLEYFFKNASITRAVAHGREQMVDKSDARKYLDWSFPALFLTEDAPEKLSILSNYIENYIPLLEEMQRIIPKVSPRYYFAREELEKKLNTFFKNNQNRVRLIFGGLGSGKTSLVRYICHQVIDKAINGNYTWFRPILYIDFDRYQKWNGSITDLIDILKRNSEKISRENINYHPFNWPPVKNFDGKIESTKILSRLVHFIDRNKMVLVFDNLSAEQLESLEAFIEGAESLRQSLLIVVSDIKSTWISSRVAIDTAYALEVDKLSKKENEDYIKKHLPERNALQLYEKTGGILLLLNEIRISPSIEEVMNITTPQTDLTYTYINILIHRIKSSGNSELLRLIYSLALFPNGLNQELSNEYVVDWPELEKLKLIDSLIVEYRYDKSQRWVRLPGIITQALNKHYQEEMEQNAVERVNYFLEQIIPSDEDDESKIIEKIENHLIELASKHGGVNFLHEIHEIFVKYEYIEQARAIPIMLHKWLYRNGRWNDSYKFWERFLEDYNGKSDAHEWVKFAKTAHMLGMQTEADNYLYKATKLDPTILDSIDILIQKAALIKDSGRLEKASDIHSNYKKAIDLIEKAERNSKDQDFKEYSERKALVFYNRAIFRRWWEHDLDGALEDLEKSIKIFDSLGPSLLYMMKVVESERVDMLIDETKNMEEWETLLNTLYEVDKFFIADSNPGDRATSNYRLARCFRHMPAKDEKEREKNLICAWEAYGIAYQQAKIAGDLRMQLIAQCHLVEVKWQHSSEMKDIEAMDHLDHALDYLREFKEDAWSTRVLRDMLLLQAEVARKLHQTKRVIDILREAWETALHKTLHPEKRTDALRAAKILYYYIRELVNLDSLLDIRLDKIGYKKLVGVWLGSSNYSTDELPEKLKEFYENDRR